MKHTVAGGKWGALIPQTLCPHPCATPILMWEVFKPGWLSYPLRIPHCVVGQLYGGSACPCL